MNKIKVLSWNIGGGKIRQLNSNPSVMDSYSLDGFMHIHDLLFTEKPDIVTLQESHKNSTSDIVQQLSDKLGYQYYTHDSTSISHVDSNFKLGHAVISKYPLSDHVFGLFDNPQLEVLWEDGTIAKSFDKGYSSVRVAVNGSLALNVTTTHLIPFKRFKLGIDSEDALKILNDVDKKITRKLSPWIVLGDFNIDSRTVASYFPTVFHAMDEISMLNPTTPNGRRYDHILFNGLRLVEYRVASETLTDHFPVIATFEY